jgi:hypothetical protein
MTDNVHELKPRRKGPIWRFYLESEDDIRQIEGLTAAILVLATCDHGTGCDDAYHAIAVEIGEHIEAIKDRCPAPDEADDE